jgi:hypothetical protein
MASDIYRAALLNLILLSASTSSFCIGSVNDLINLPNKVFN